MMWLTLRQFRAQAIAAAAALAVLLVVFVVTSLSLTHLYDTSGLAACHSAAACRTVASKFFDQVKANRVYDALFFFGIGVLFLAPAVIGMFWGAPLIAREVEAGTFRLAWNQSVTRRRWIAIKLGLVGLAAMATAGLLSLLVTWWASPIDRAIAVGGSPNGANDYSRLDPLVFGARDIVPIGYAAFAFVLGVAVGVLIRRTVPAIAVTLAGFAFIQVAWPNWIRPHLVAPVRATVAINPASLDQLITSSNGQVMIVQGNVNLPGAWVLSNQSITPSGHVFTGPATQACQSRTAPFQACLASVGRLHLRQVLTYQPASRFWALQWYETAIFVALAVALGGFCAWRISRRHLA